MRVMKSPTSRRIDFQSTESLGSNTTHEVPSWIDSSIMLKRRRTFTYRQSEAGSASVRAPQAITPLLLKKRMQLTPSGLSASWSASRIGLVTPTALRTGSLAGALCTPRVASVRA